MKQFIQLIRRGHLYLGLFLFPWAIFYGITGFLFNHPAVLNGNQGGKVFGPDLFQGTPLESSLDPDLIAKQVVDKLNEKNGSVPPQYTLEGAATLSGRKVEASVSTEKGIVLVAMDLHHKTGTVRQARMASPKRDLSTRAPFAIGSSPAAGKAGRNEGGNEKSSKQGPRGSDEKGKSAGEGLSLQDGFANRTRNTLPRILESLGYPAPYDINISLAPNIQFPIKDAADKIWMVTYHGANGAVSGEPALKTTPAENEGLSWRNFLTRLHKTHGYPADPGTATFWALLVDVMAGTMCFWGISGVFMWWQLKVLRKTGLVVLFLSFLFTIPLLVFMYGHLAASIR